MKMETTVSLDSSEVVRDRSDRAEVTWLAQTYLGNVKESADLTRRVLQAREDGRCLEVMVERCDRNKGRVFAQATVGQAVGIVKGRDWSLRDGDVFVTEQGRLVLVSVQPQTVVVITLDGMTPNAPAALMRLGHMVGNHHWPISVKGRSLYVEPVVEPSVVESMLQEAAQRLGIDGMTVQRSQRSAQDSIEFSPLSGHHHSHG